jgi:DNA polymerase-3 subunit delta'
LTLDEVRGQPRAIEVLKRALARGRLAHALILTGPPGTGKRTTAIALAAGLLCGKIPGRGCGECQDCHLVALETHPDLFVEDLARAQAERASASLSIEQIRRVRAHLALRPVRATGKVALIDPADRMTIDAQNALLKTLEEPPGQTTLILLATNADALLPTIRSRCQCVRFAPLEDEIIYDILVQEGIEAEEARRAAGLADGSLAQARTLADAEAIARSQELQDKLAGLASLSLPDALDLSAELAGGRGERARAQQAMQVLIMLSWYRSQLCEVASSGKGTDADEALEPVRAALKRLEEAYATSRDLEQNANVHLAWDRLLLELREA